MSASMPRRHDSTTGAGGCSRACRPLGLWALTILVMSVAALVVGATDGASNAAQGDTPTASPIASPVASPAASPEARAEGPPTLFITGEVTIEVSDAEFMPSYFESAVGRDVIITVTNTGTRPHNFSIDAFDIDIDLAPGETATVEIENPELGRYTFYSDLPRDDDLQGAFTVFI